MKINHTRAKYEFLVYQSKTKSLAIFPQYKLICGCFLKEKKPLVLFPLVKNISVVVLQSKRIFFCCPKQNKADFVSADLYKCFHVKIFHSN